jgi:hypothetical protein
MEKVNDSFLIGKEEQCVVAETTELLLINVYKEYIYLNLREFEKYFVF